MLPRTLCVARSFIGSSYVLTRENGMAGLLDVVNQQIGGSAARQIGAQIDADPASTQKAIGAALPVLLSGLARNANRSPQSLASALEREHDGGLLDSLSGVLGGIGGGTGLGSLLGGSQGGGSGLDGLLGAAGSLLGGASASSRTTDGDGILRHVLGDKRPAVEKEVAQASGLDVAKVSRLLTILAPIVMGALGRMKQQRNLDAAGIATMLNQERARVEEQTPGMTQGGLLGLLDRDSDGDVSDDVATLASKLSESGLLDKLFGS